MAATTARSPLRALEGVMASKSSARRGDIVLELFGGSGSTLIAVHKTGRRRYLCELDPLYCDGVIRRWEAYTKDEAELSACGVAQPPEAAPHREAAEWTAHANEPDEDGDAAASARGYEVG